MQIALVSVLLCLASGLEVEKPRKEPEEIDGGKYAYVTMWINKPAAPAHVFTKVLTKEETVSLNTGNVINVATGTVDLSKGQSIRTSVLETEGKPKQKKQEEEPFRIPLRPRNSNYNGILDIAKNLRDVGAKYPLVVLTNSDELKNQTLLAENPNLQLIWLNETDFLERHCKIGAGHELHFQKLMIWKLTQFDKLIWMDTDVAFTKPVDYVFKMNTNGGSRIYGQIDDYHCDGREWSPTSGGICSAMLLVKPNKLHFNGLMAQQKRMQSCWGDQSIISSYFTGGAARTEAMQFQRSTINFARCKSMGRMDVVHFSGSPDARRVGDPEGFKRTTTGQLVNITAMKIKAQEKAMKKKEAEQAKKDAKKQKSLLQQK